MLTIDKLNEYGANTAEGVARCMGNEALYLRLASTVADQALPAGWRRNGYTEEGAES